jgi:hypothetical protein
MRFFGALLVINVAIFVVLLPFVLAYRAWSY